MLLIVRCTAEDRGQTRLKDKAHATLILLFRDTSFYTLKREPEHVLQKRAHTKNRNIFCMNNVSMTTVAGWQASGCQRCGCVLT